MTPDNSYFEKLSEAMLAVIRGDYRAATKMFELTRGTGQGAGLAEMFGMMTVKVEAREFALEQALAKVQKKNVELEQAAHLHEDFSRFFVGSILLLCSYSLLLEFLKNVMGFHLGPTSMASYVMNLLLFVMYCLLIVWFTRQRAYPMATFGFTLVNWKRAMAESMAALIPVLLLLMLVKMYLVSKDPRFYGQPLINWKYWGPKEMWFVYAPSSIAQEFTARGFQQTCIERLLTGKYRTVIAVVLTSAQFAVIHLHYSFFTGVVAFAGALLFGFLYARHRTIVGVTAAHYLLGQLVFGPLELIR